MYEYIFLIVLALIWLIFASAHDIKSREVANWLSFSLIIFAIGFRFFYSLFYLENFNFFYQGLIGLGIFFILGNLFYYGKIFAGGDAKLMIALGSVLPFSENVYTNLKMFMYFLLIFLFVGLFYSLIWSFVMTIKNFRIFKKEFKVQWKKYQRLSYILILISLFVISFSFLEIIYLLIGLFILFFPFLIVYAKSVDEACMIKKISVEKLTEGDWLYRDVKIGKKLIKANWEGLSKKEIQLIKKNYKNILIRQGIPFVPVFLISFLVLMWIFFKEFF